MERLKRTEIAQQGVDFATLFAAKFSGLDVSGFVPLMREPPADSTGGGKQALQHLVLHPKIHGDPVITFGSFNVATRSARLRTHACLERMHRMRYGKSAHFVLDQEKYQELIDQLLRFTKQLGMQVDIETNPPPLELGSGRPPARVKRDTTGSWILLFILTAIAAFLTYVLLQRLRP